jgi:hypothetical protein
MSADTQRTTRRYIPEDGTLQENQYIPKDGTLQENQYIPEDGTLQENQLYRIILMIK